jgi:cytochrome c551/c552
MSNDLHRYENDLPRFLLIGLVIGVIALLLTIVAYTIGRNQGETSSNAVAPTQPAGTAAPTAQGKALFTQFGCGGCHTFAPADATGTIGPDLATASQAAKTDHGTPLDTYIRQSITDPNAYVTPGYHSGIMPTFYASKLTPTQLQALAAFIAAGQKP